VPVVQLYFNKNDYEDLETRARTQGYGTVPEYIRGQVLPESEYDRFLRVLIKSAERAVPGTHTVASLIGPDFYDIPIGVRFSLGRAFFRRVAAGSIPHLFLAGEVNGSQTYMKEE
jgi:hypothetical protein